MKRVFPCQRTSSPLPNPFLAFVSFSASLLHTGTHSPHSITELDKVHLSELLLESLLRLSLSNKVEGGPPYNSCFCGAGAVPRREDESCCVLMSPWHRGEGGEMGNWPQLPARSKRSREAQQFRESQSLLEGKRGGVDRKRRPTVRPPFYFFTQPFMYLTVCCLDHIAGLCGYLHT